MLKQGKTDFTPKSREPIDIPKRQHVDASRGHRDDEPSGLPWGWIVLGIIILGAIVFFLFPAVKGYRAYAAMRDYGVPDEYIADVQGLMDENMVCGGQLNETTRERDECTTDRALCVQDLNAQRALVESLGQDLGQRGADLEACETDSASKDAALADAARRICCADRVLRDPSISGYVLSDGRISCVTEGGTSVSC